MIDSQQYCFTRWTGHEDPPKAWWRGSFFKYQRKMSIL